MAHVPLPEGLPGIIGPLTAYPRTARPLNELAQVLLRGPSTLTEGERELIATYVSHLNACVFCTSSHGAAAKHLLNSDYELVEQVRQDFEHAAISDKLKALLRIARKVQQGGRRVSEEDVVHARALGVTDQELHDTVLIAAAFCMYNRYVDGLSTFTPVGLEAYDGMGQRLASAGYMMEDPVAA